MGQQPPVGTFRVCRLYNSPFPKKQSVRHAHQSTFHIAFRFSDKLYAIHEQPLKRILADISFVRNRLAIDKFDKSLVFQRYPVIHISRSEHKIENFTFIIDYQM